MSNINNNHLFKGEWLDTIPLDWKQSKIKHLFKIKKDISGELGHEVISITQKGAKIKDTESGDGQLSMDYSKYQLVTTGDFLMNHMDLLTGYVDISRFDGVTSPDYRVFVLSDISSSPNYYLYVFQHCYKSKIFYAYGRGSSQLGRWRFPTVEFDDFYLPVPSLKEQQLISKYLDKKLSQIDSLIEKTQRKIELLKEQQTATINHYVTKGLDPTVKMKDSGIEWIGEIPEHWSITKLKFKLKKIGSGVTPKGGSEVYTDEGVMFLRSQNIHFEGLVLEDVVRITPQTHIEMSGSTVQLNDVLLNITGGSIGRCCVVDLNEDFNVNQHVCILRPTDFITSEFLFYFLRSDIGQTQVYVNQTGSGREGLNFENLGNFNLPFCSIDEQLCIGNKIKQIDQNFISLINKEIHRIELLKEYRQSLISTVVTGKVRVTEEVI